MSGWIEKHLQDMSNEEERRRQEEARRQEPIRRMESDRLAKEEEVKKEREKKELAIRAELPSLLIVSNIQSLLRDLERELSKKSKVKIVSSGEENDLHRGFALIKVNESREEETGGGMEESSGGRGGAEDPNYRTMVYRPHYSRLVTNITSKVVLAGVQGLVDSEEKFKLYCASYSGHRKYMYINPRAGGKKQEDGGKLFMVDNGLTNGTYGETNYRPKEVEDSFDFEKETFNVDPWREKTYFNMRGQENAFQRKLIELAIK